MPKFMPEELDLSSPLGPSAVTSGVVNMGAEMAQWIRHLPHLFKVHKLNFTVVEATTAAALMETQKKIDLNGQPTNLIWLCPSVRNNAVHLSIGGKLDFATYNGISYPLGDWWIPPSCAPFPILIPTRENYEFAVVPFATEMTAGYQDGVQIVTGYVPVDVERRVGRD